MSNTASNSFYERLDIREIIKKWDNDDKDAALELLLLDRLRLGDNCAEQIPIEGPISQCLIGWFIPLAPFVEFIDSPVD